MTRIRVYRPDVPIGLGVGRLQLAERTSQATGGRLLLIDNSKPKARALMERIAERVRDRLMVNEVEVHTKASAGKALEGDETRMLAARARLVITGLGD